MPIAHALDTQSITKRFPGVLANDHIDFELRQGEIHALLGENGAGKTTLMNIVYGLYHQDEGEIRVNGQPVTIRDSNDAIHLGIGMVHQHFMLIPVFTVAENIMLGQESVVDWKTLGVKLPAFTWGRVLLNSTMKVILDWWLDRRTASQRVRELSHQYGLEVDPDAYVHDLPVGVQQRVEIVKALYRHADILILDEPTAVLTPQEIVDLFRIMRELVSRGVSIIFITHKLKEVLEIADRITVLRNGRVVGTVTPQETDEHKLAAMMVGREVILSVEKGPAHPTDQVLRVEALQVLDDRGVPVVNGASFFVRAGEVLGLAGVQGNGQTELVEALTGLRPALGGMVKLLGREMTHQPPRAIIETGTAHIPEDRHKHGLVLPFPVTDNLVLCSYYRLPFARLLRMDYGAIDENARQQIRDFDIRAPSEFIPVESLSGGNQQKVIVARELSRPIKLLIANQPTRGLDVGSIEYIHNRIVEMRDRGCAVLLVSAELDEILSLSDRIAVMYKGRIIETLDAGDATRERLGLLMAGVKP